jgi:predicted O-methyltransferase YrrM
MGTALGVSAAYQAAALRLNSHGALVTIEGATSLADIARNNFQQLCLDTVEVVVGRFQDTLTNVLTNRQPVDYVFVDGHHDEQATRAYFEQILPFLAEEALLVFDDITWSEGMRRAWNTLAKDRRVDVTVDLGPVGLRVVDSSIAGLGTLAFHCLSLNRRITRLSADAINRAAEPNRVCRVCCTAWR